MLDKKKVKIIRREYVRKSPKKRKKKIIDKKQYSLKEYFLSSQRKIRAKIAIKRKRANKLG